MGFIRRILFLIVLAMAGLMAYNYYNGHGFVLMPPKSTGPERASDMAGTATEKAREAAGRIEEAASEGSLSAKILAKMALDDIVKARNIGVHTSGTVVTLTGYVTSDAERQRAVQLAKETTGVTHVVDKLEKGNP